MQSICSYAAPAHEIEVLGEAGPFKVRLRDAGSKEGITVLRMTAQAPSQAPAPKLTLRWTHPALDIQGTWHPRTRRDRKIPPDWAAGKHVSRATESAPVMSLYNLAGRNRLTFALSDAVNACTCSAGIREETAEFICQVQLLTEATAPMDHYQVVLRIDNRDLPLEQVLASISGWWGGMERYRPTPVPDVARMPMYSTWYSFHQRLDVDALVKQCELAAELGCKAIIVDDGWQTTDAARGYACCGDWKPERIPEMADFVRRVHETGLKVLLWYAVPFIGYKSENWKRFEDKLLYRRDRLKAGILDPRYPEVRRFLIETYAVALERWDLDGFKLDFVNNFYPTEESAVGPGDGRDMASVALAADRLLADIMTRLAQIKPEICVEFRQPYIGPAMRKYGNMFRAGDCPGDSVTNRVATIDIRLLAGDTACHGDMLMWHKSESAPAAALQLLGSFFAVPQISVRLDEIPDEHLAMLRFYLDFWIKHRHVLLGGKLSPASPVSLYPTVTARDDETCIAVQYDRGVVHLPAPLAREIYIINATGGDQVALDLGEPFDRCEMRALDCMGNSVADDSALLPEGLYSLPCPPGGMIVLRKA